MIESQQEKGKLITPNWLLAFGPIRSLISLLVRDINSVRKRPKELRLLLSAFMIAAILRKMLLMKILTNGKMMRNKDEV
jgi:hypothetical protein